MRQSKEISVSRRLRHQGEKNFRYQFAASHNCFEMLSTFVFLLASILFAQSYAQMGLRGPPGPPGPPGAPGLPAPCQDECVGKGCEPACLVGCCGYHGLYGKSKRWIIENILNQDED